MENEKFSSNIKSIMRENAMILLRELFIEKIEHQIILWNNNDWDKELPLRIMENFSEQIVLNIDRKILKNSNIDENGNISISVEFDDSTYKKTIFNYEIIGILGTNGSPYILNNFSQDDYMNLDEFDDFGDFGVLSEEDLVNTLRLNGVPEKNAKKSIELFIDNLKTNLKTN